MKTVGDFSGHSVKIGGAIAIFQCLKGAGVCKWIKGERIKHLEVLIEPSLDEHKISTAMRFRRITRPQAMWLLQTLWGEHSSKNMDKAIKLTGRWQEINIQEREMDEMRQQSMEQ